MKENKALILFAKTPLAGFVKTRLQPQLRPEDAALIYQAFIRDTLSLTAPLRGVSRLIGCAGRRGHASRHPFFRDLARMDDLRLFNQSGKTLGDRLGHAFRFAFRQGFKKVVIIGTDSPTLPTDYLREAFRVLNRLPVVLGPGRDGGYYLIGAAGRTPPIFKGITWGSEKVLEQTLGQLNRRKLRAHLLPFWYDVDTIQDLRFLKNHLLLLNNQHPSGPGRNSRDVLKILEI